MKKLVAFTSLATLGLLIVIAPAAAQDAAHGGADAAADAAALAHDRAIDLAKASGNGFKGIGGGLAAGIGALGAGVGPAGYASIQIILYGAGRGDQRTGAG